MKLWGWVAGGLVVVGILVWVYVSRDTSKSPSWGQRDEKLAEMRDRLKQILVEIQQAHGPGECDSSYQCKVVGLGKKSCGGYNDFLIYSTQDAKEDQLLDLVRKYNEIAEQYADMSMQAPPCGQAPKPIVCEHHECVPRD